MTVINKQFLASIGITLNDEDYAVFTEQYEATLDARIVDEIVNELTPTQLQELAEYKNRSEYELQQWLTDNVPDLSQIVEEEIAILLGEIAESSDAFDRT
ncbi:hypothetical protein EOL96_03540 [Candidatus Saccharibacteria bacterium]|nr:hypothetical protein [Candidatus Saccharibacteria bacterium]